MVLLLGVCCASVAQTLDYAMWKTHQVISLSTKNLLTLVDCTSREFTALMERYGYEPSRRVKPSDRTHVVYENGALDFFLDGNSGLGSNFVEKSETSRHVQIFGKIEHLFPKNSLTLLRNTLDPYFRDKTPEGADRYLIYDDTGGGYLILIEMENETHYHVHIRHLRKMMRFD